MPVVFIISPKRLHREGIASLLRQAIDVEVGGTGATACDAATAQPRPDIVVIDDLPVDEAGRLAQQLPQARIVALGVREDAALAWMEAGVGFLFPDATVTDLVSAVYRARESAQHAAPAGAAREAGEPTRLQREADGEWRPLTPREEGVLVLMGEGLTNKQIAGQLVVSEATIKNHVHSILGKLGARKRAQAAALARDRGVWWRQRGR